MNLIKGFRDIIQKLTESYQFRTYIPTLKTKNVDDLSQGEVVQPKQLTTKQANDSRLVSKVIYYIAL